MISLIVAMGKNRVIGNGPDIPWRLPADFAYFKRVTDGKPLIMGLKTHHAIGRVLPGRKNIVLTTDKNVLVSEGSIKASTFDEALSLAGNGEVFVIGGGQVYTSTISRANKLYVTFVDGEFVGDIFFPEIDMKIWKEVSREHRLSDEKNPYALDFVVFERYS